MSLRQALAPGSTKPAVERSAQAFISRGLSGADGNANSATMAFGMNGRTVAFHSVANDLTSGNDNDKLDVFSFTLGGGDVDNDGLDDDWEVTYFGDRSRDGTGDFDGDGVNDRTEFLSQTDPTNTGSVFRVGDSRPLTTRPGNWFGRAIRPAATAWNTKRT